MFINEALYILRPKPDHGAAIAETDRGQARISPCGMISDPGFRNAEKLSNLIEREERSVCAWFRHRSALVRSMNCNRFSSKYTGMEPTPPLRFFPMIRNSSSGIGLPSSPTGR